MGWAELKVGRAEVPVKLCVTVAQTGGGIGWLTRDDMMG